ncbi:hypothetical protein CHS0354_024378 [Potamilus streckersoni]|uniref:Insulin receptor substrate 1 n=1 Tax=Potamilus streckersoni TaxID=2493646 RepID=A0AAE0VTU6_9BIVA|nr:hypothetical protein CHS0354_024378 [Potamilus streckersoni]
MAADRNRFSTYGYPLRFELPGSDIQKTGFLKKLKTMKKKFFVLRSTSSSGPARFEYFDSEKKFTSNQLPKRSILLHQCFNINKKTDARHRYAIVLFTKEDSFSFITENEVEQETWLNLLLEYQNEYLLMTKEQPRPHFEHVWQGIIKQKSNRCLTPNGHYRLCLSSKEVSLARVNWDKIEYTFQFTSIRKCGNSESYFFMEVGRQASTGEGEIWIQVEDSTVAQKIHETVLTAMTAARSLENSNRMRARSQTTTARPPVDTSASAIRARAVSESHSSGWQVSSQLPSDQRPQSQIFTQSRTSLSPTEPAFPIGSPQSLLPPDAVSADLRGRSDSAGSRSSGGSRSVIEQPDLTSHGVVSYRSTTPDTPISEENPENYLNMTPSHRSTTPSPTHDRLERPGSSGSGESQGEIGSKLNDGYVDMKPNSPLSSCSNDSRYTDMSPGALKVPNSESGYLMMGSVTPSGSIPGRTIASIPIWSSKEQGYLDMGPPCQYLPTVKEGGSGEAYLPMTPTSQSPVSSDFPKPAKVISYLSDDSMSGEFPKRAYSVGSRPSQNHGVHRPYQTHDMMRKQAVSDNNRSSSAPHLIGQRPRTAHGDSRSPYVNSSVGSSSPLSQSIRSDDVDGFMEIDFYRPRTASDSYGCRGRSSSFGKSFVQGHRPRSSSYGQASRGKLGSYESVRTTSQELIMKKISHDSLGQLSVSSLASSNESMRKLSEESQGSSVQSDYVDMGCNKGKTPSPVTQATEKDGYVDMTVGSRSGPPSVSQSSSSQSLGSSPASLGRTKRETFSSEAVIIKSSGQVKQCPGFISTPPSASGGSQKNQLQVIGTQSKKSPSSSGRESEDESYVPYQPGIKCGSLPTPQGEYLECHSHRDRSSSSGKRSDRSNSGVGSHDRSFTHGDHSPSSKKVDTSRGLVQSGQSIEQSHLHSLDKSSKFDNEFSVRSKGFDGHSQQRSSQESHSSKYSKIQNSEGKSGSVEKHLKDKQNSKTNISSGKKTPPLPKSKDDSVYIGYEPDISKALMQQSVFQFPSPVSGLEHSSGKSGKTQHWEVGGHQLMWHDMPAKAYTDSKSVLSDGKNVLSRDTREENKKSKSLSTTSPVVQHSAAPPSDYEIYDPLGSRIFASESKYRTPEQQGTKAESSKPEQKTASALFDKTGFSEVTQLKESKTSHSSKKKRSDAEAEIFSYVDYYPKDESNSDSKNWEIKTPSRVSSFISELSEDRSNTDLNTSHGISGTDESSINVGKSASTKIEKSSSQSDCKKGSGNCSPVQEVRNAKEPVPGQVNKGEESDKHVNKFLEDKVKDQGLSLKLDIQDDGYIDLDFSTQKGSSKDKGVMEHVAQFSIGEQGDECADLIQNPKCYILDENDATDRTERSTADKSSPTKRLLPLNPVGVDRPQGNSSKESVQKVMMAQTQDSPLMGLTSSSVPNQTAIPTKLPALQKSNLESPRLRNTSGPASYRSAGNGSNGEQNKKVVGPIISNPSQTVPESHQQAASLGKQNSMPCMAIQVESEPQVESELQAVDLARSRHSLSDLSSYEEMNFSAERTKFGSLHQLQGLEPKQVTLNYASLDLGSSENVDENGQRKNRHSSCLEDSEPKEKVSYAEIDFQKSENLKNSTNKSAKFTL